MLYFFGDSHAYGQGLEDCCIENNYAGPEPSSLAFPKLISDMLGTTYVNLAIPGSSNQQILHQLRTSDITVHDIAIFHWSHWSRAFIMRQDNPVQVGHWFNHTKSYYQLHDDNSLKYDSFKAIEHAELWCKDKKIQYLMFSTHSQDCQIANSHIIDFMDIHAIDFAKDDIHFGQLTHNIWADIVVKHITDLLRPTPSMDTAA